MTQADSVYSTPPTNTPIVDDPVHGATECIIMLGAGAIIAFWIFAAIAGCLIATHLEDKIAARCAVSQQKAVRP